MLPFSNLAPSIKEELSKCHRHFFIRTYAEPKVFLRVFEEKKKAGQVAGLAYICHDKDEGKEPHSHIVLVLDRDRKGQTVYNWFENCRDEDGISVNTEVQVLQSMDAAEKYITHSDEKSIEAGKHQYTEEDIKYLDGVEEPWTYKTKADLEFGARQKKEKNADDTEKLLQDIIDEVPWREMARRYGRDYIKNVKAYRDYAAQVVIEEDGDFDKAHALISNLTQRQNQEELRQQFVAGVKSTAIMVERALTDSHNLNALWEVLKMIKEM